MNVHACIFIYTCILESDIVFVVQSLVTSTSGMIQIILASSGSGGAGWILCTSTTEQVGSTGLGGI